MIYKMLQWNLKIKEHSPNITSGAQRITAMETTS